MQQNRETLASAGRDGGVIKIRILTCLLVGAIAMACGVSTGSRDEGASGDRLGLMQSTSCAGADGTEVTGIVVDAESKAPLPAVVVLLTRACGVLTDSLGRYSILDVDEGTTTVRFETISHCADSATFVRGSLTRFDMQLRPRRVPLSHDPEPVPEC